MHLDDVRVIGGGPAGLFASILIKRAQPAARVKVYERSVPDDTFGFGVAFTPRTLELLSAADEALVRRLRDASVPMPPQELRVAGRSVRNAGNDGAIGIARSALLGALIAAAREVGVEVELGRAVTIDQVRDADLVIAADGVGSEIRASMADDFEALVEPSRGLFMWLGLDGRLDSNLFVPIRTADGLFNIHCYPYAADRSTIGVETSEAAWRSAGMDRWTDDTAADESDKRSIEYLQDAFGATLGGASLLGNRSRWMRFRTVTARRWSAGNVVLIGDAAHTAHYSVGSGTKLAMEDAVALVEALHTHDNSHPNADGPRPLAMALAAYEAARRPRVARIQDLADRSRWWWETLDRRLDLPPTALMLAYLSRGGVVSAKRVAQTDGALVATALHETALQETALLGSGPVDGPLVAESLVAAALDDLLDRPCVIGGRTFPSRVLGDGPAEERWRVVAADVRDPWGEEAAAVVEAARQWADDGAEVILLTGSIARDRLLDRLALAENVRLALAGNVRPGGPVAVAVEADRGYADDIVDAVIAGRVDLVRYRAEAHLEETVTTVTPDPEIIGYPAEFARAYREAGLWRDRTIPAALRQTGHDHPDAMAVLTRSVRWSYRDLLRRVDNIAAGLVNAGLRPGDPVILQVTNSAWVVAAFYGMLRAGLRPVCTLAIHRRHEITQIGTKTHAVAHLIQADLPGFDLVAFAAEMAREIPTMTNLLTIGATAEAPGVRIEDIGDRDAAPAELARLAEIERSTDLNAPAILQLSGGTTGTPKVIPRLHAEYWYNGLATAQWWSLGEADRLAFCLPIVHNAGTANALFAAHSVGAALLLTTPRADDLLPLMAYERATWILLPPGVAGEFLKDSRFDGAFARVRTCVLSAAAVPRRLFDELEERGVHTTQAFGMTEGLFLFTPHDAPADLRAGSVGIPISPHDEVRLLDPGSEDPVPDGEIGELCVRGPYTIRGYLAEPLHNRAAFTSDGFYRSGDLASRIELAGQPTYVLNGRTKDLINRGGEKINAEEIEGLLVGHPSVLEAAVVAMPDPRLGERACAFIAVRAGQAPPTLRELCDYLDSLGVAKFKWPERLELVAELPRTNIGKVQKVRLRASVAESGPTTIAL
jgi:2,3-dihydroxybenzoate-AMP ligase